MTKVVKFMDRITFKEVAFFCLLICFSISVFSQEDSTNTPVKDIIRITDTLDLSQRDSLYQINIDQETGEVVIDSLKRRKGFAYLLNPGPRPPFEASVAWKRSIIFPGWGQIYNKAWWKLPLVYGGYTGFILVIQFNDDQYKEFRQAFNERTDEDETNDFNTIEERFSDDAIKNARDAARRNRDFTIILTVGFHVLQTVEAFVDAHLKGFDISEDLTMDIHPTIINTEIPNYNQQLGTPGIAIAWRLKN